MVVLLLIFLAQGACAVLFDVSAYSHSIHNAPLSTGISVTAGEIVNFTTSFNHVWNLDNSTSGFEVNADGLSELNTYCDTASCTFTTAEESAFGQAWPEGLLVGKVGSGPFFPVGTSGFVRIPRSGTLSLACWGSEDTADNSGEIRVEVVVQDTPESLGELSLIVTQTFTVDARSHAIENSPLVTPRTIRAGQFVVFHAAVDDIWSTGPESNHTTNADGLSQANQWCVDSPNCSAFGITNAHGQRLPSGIVAGKIGSGPYFHVGTSAAIRADRDGTLFLLCMDGLNAPDNVGTIDITVSVYDTRETLTGLIPLGASSDFVVAADTHTIGSPLSTIAVSANQIIEFTATGTWDLFDGTPGFTSNADGVTAANPECTPANDCTEFGEVDAYGQYLPHGLMVGSVDSGQFFHVGTASSVRMERSGTLSLAMADSNKFDNAGSIFVAVRAFTAPSATASVSASVTASVSLSVSLSASLSASGSLSPLFTRPSERACYRVSQDFDLSGPRLDPASYASHLWLRSINTMPALHPKVTHGVCGGGLQAGDPIPYGSHTAASQWSSTGETVSALCGTEDDCLFEKNNLEQCRANIDGYLNGGALIYGQNFPEVLKANTGYTNPQASQLYFVQDDENTVAVLFVHRNDNVRSEVGIEVTSSNLPEAVTIGLYDNYGIVNTSSPCLLDGSGLVSTQDCYQWDSQTQSGTFYWKVAPCCGDGMALSRLPLAGFSLSIVYHNLQNFPTVQMSTYNTTTSHVTFHDATPAIASAGLLVEAFECNALCASLSNCTACVAMEGLCVWCSGTNACEDADATLCESPRIGAGMQCPSLSPSASPTASVTTSLSPTASLTASPSPSPTPNPSLSSSVSYSVSATVSSSPSPSPSPSPSLSPSPSPSPSLSRDICQACPLLPCVDCENRLGFPDCFYCHRFPSPTCNPCFPRNCPAGHVCDIGVVGTDTVFQCIPAILVGDGIRDCLDGSDEIPLMNQCGSRVGEFNPFGNGVRDTTEECDDGNLERLDGCSDLCVVEPGFTCVGRVGEQSVCKAVVVPTVQGDMTLCVNGTVNLANNQTAQEYFAQGVSDAFGVPRGSVSVILDIDPITNCTSLHYEIQHATSAEAIQTSQAIINTSDAEFEDTLGATLGRDIGVVIGHPEIVLPRDPTLEPVVFDLRSSNPENPSRAGPGHRIELVPVALGEALGVVSVRGLSVGGHALLNLNTTRVEFRGVTTANAPLPLFTVAPSDPSGSVVYRVHYADRDGNKAVCLSHNRTCVNSRVTVDTGLPVLSVLSHRFVPPAPSSGAVLVLEAKLRASEPVRRTSLQFHDAVAVSCEDPCDLVVRQWQHLSSRSITLIVDVVGFVDGAVVQFDIGHLVEDFTGNQNADEQFTVTLPSLTYLSPTLFVATSVIAGLVAVVSLVNVVSIYLLRRVQIIRSLSPLFSALVILGILLALLSIPAAGIPRLDCPSSYRDIACATFPHLILNSVVIILAALIVKNWRLHKIFNNSRLRVLRLTDILLFRYLLSLFLPSFIVTTIWGVVYSSHSSIDLTTLNYTCESSGAFLHYLTGCYVVCLMAVGAVLCYRLWRLPEQWNEARRFVWACCGILAVVVLVVPSFFLVTSVDGSFLLISIGILSGCISLLLFLFVIKLPGAVQRRSDETSTANRVKHLSSGSSQAQLQLPTHPRRGRIQRPDSASTSSSQQMSGETSMQTDASMLSRISGW